MAAGAGRHRACLAAAFVVAGWIVFLAWLACRT